MQKKKGISLIVLVITIIVMIILSAAVINILKDSNIITNAQTAKESTESANEKQIISMANAIAASKSKTGKATIETMKEALQEIAR